MENEETTKNQQTNYKHKSNIAEFLQTDESILWKSKTYANVFAKSKIENEISEVKRTYISGHYAQDYTVSAKTQMKETMILYIFLALLGVGFIITSILTNIWFLSLISIPLFIAVIIKIISYNKDIKLFKKLIPLSKIYVLTNKRLLILNKLEKLELDKEVRFSQIKSIELTRLYRKHKDIGDIVLQLRNSEEIEMICVEKSREVCFKLKEYL